MEKKTLEDLKVGECCILSESPKDNPKLGAKLMSNGKASLFLDFYFGYTMVYSESQDKMIPKKQKRRETLKDLYLYQKPRNINERHHNKETQAEAEKKRLKRALDMTEPEIKETLTKKKVKVNFLDYFQTYINNYSKKDLRMVKIALQRFKDFLHDTPEYSIFERNIKPEQLSKDMMVDFTEYLQSRGRGEGPHAIYARFKKVVAYAVEHDVIRKNPCTGVSITIDENVLRKEILSADEIQLLATTHHSKENKVIRRAFLLSCCCGLRFCDVKDLTFANVDYSNKLLKFEQSKTKGHSANSGVVIPLNESLLQLIGTPQEGQSKDSLIFPLPTYWMCVKSVQRWAKEAGISKHLSWHCARHSFAVNILNKGANIKTVASLLGHSGLKHTEKYTRAVDELKREAINSLPKIEL